METTVLNSQNEQNNARIKKNRFKVGKVAAFAVCLLYFVLLMVPFYVIIITAITPNIEYGSSTSFIWFPRNPVFQPFLDIFQKDPMILMKGVPSILIGFGNTLWMGLFTCTISVFVSGLAGYAYSKLHFKGKEVLFTIEIATMMIPTATLTIPSFAYYNAIGWGQGFLPLIVPILFGGAQAIFFTRSFMTGIPDEIVQAAKIDGLGFFGIYLKIILPLSIPALLSQFIFSFVGMYNNYAGPLLYLYENPEWYTLQLALGNMQSIFRDANQQCAMAIIAMIPLILVYLVAQKFFLEGVSEGGVKE